MKNFANIEDFSFDFLSSIVSEAINLKKNKFNNNLKNKTMVGLFFNPSTRTRTSFELAMIHQGGHFISLEPGTKSWGIDYEENITMDGNNEEHLKEVVNVLGEYADCIGVRAFPKFENWDYDKKDIILNNMLKWSSVPIINMETISHPTQALAMLMTMQEKFTNLKKKKFVLTWSYHPKGLNTAVANSALVVAAMSGMNVTVVNPPDYNLDEKYINTAKNFLKLNGGSLTLSNNQEESLKDADFVYVKSWGSLNQYGHYNFEEQSKHKDWMLTQKKMNLTNNAYISHCLPVRRNVVIADEVLDSRNSLIYQEAGNRLHVQKAILNYLLIGDK
jgi:N-acetylornithine carbamoyltransferase